MVFTYSSFKMAAKLAQFLLLLATILTFFGPKILEELEYQCFLVSPNNSNNIMY